MFSVEFKVSLAIGLALTFGTLVFTFIDIDAIDAGIRKVLAGICASLAVISLFCAVYCARDDLQFPIVLRSPFAPQATIAPESIKVASGAPVTPYAIPTSIDRIPMTPLEKFDPTNKSVPHANVRFFGEGDHCPWEKRWNCYGCFAFRDFGGRYRVILFFDHPLVYQGLRLDVNKEALEKLRPGTVPEPDSLHWALEDTDKLIADIVIDKSLVERAISNRQWIRIEPLPWPH